MATAEALSGAISGAGTGAAIGSAIPGIGTAIGAGVGGLAGGLIGLGTKKQKRPKPIDLTAELARISEMYNIMREQQTSQLARQEQEANKTLAQSLAARGIYRSPISAWQQTQTRRTYANALSDALARLRAEEAGKLADIGSQIKQFNYNQALGKYQQSLQDRAAIQQGLTSLGTSLLSRAFAPKTNVPSTAAQAPKQNIELSRRLLADAGSSGYRSPLENTEGWGGWY